MTRKPLLANAASHDIVVVGQSRELTIMTEPAALDHIVVTVGMHMDRAEKAFEELGFTMTPRGYHTLGSINALAMLQTDYIELLGVPADQPNARPEIANAPLGLNGIVFKTKDANATFAHLQGLGVAGDPPKSFSRPVILANGQMADAKFRTVTVAREVFPAGRLYFCEHLTPELVWRAEWQTHENRSVQIREVVIVTPYPDTLAGTMARILHGVIMADAEKEVTSVLLGRGFKLTFQTMSQFQAKFGADACGAGERTSMLGAAIISSDLPITFRNRISQDNQAYDCVTGDDEISIRIKALDALLIFAPEA